MPCARKDGIIIGNVAHAFASSIILRRRGHRRLAFYLQVEAIGLLLLAYPRTRRKIFRKLPRSLAKAGNAVGRAMTETGRAIARAAA